MITRDGVAPRVSIPPPPKVTDLRGLEPDGPAVDARFWAEAVADGMATIDELTATAWHEGRRCWLVASEVDEPIGSSSEFVTNDARWFRVTQASS